MEQSRILELSPGRKLSSEGNSVIYVMSRDQRVDDNHALLEAQATAIKLRLPLIVYFNLHTGHTVRAREHYVFMLLGLKQLSAKLSSLDITFIMRSGDAKQNILQLASEAKPAAIYFDFSPLLYSRHLAKSVAANLDIPCYVVDTHNIIPAWLASDKQEFAAHTMRGKVHKQLEKWLVEPDKIKKHPFKLTANLQSISFKTAGELIQNIPAGNLKISFISGEKAAYSRLHAFIQKEMDRYHLDRNNPTLNGLSGFSPYLHFGQMSSLRVALEVMKYTEEPPLLLLKAKLAQGGDEPSHEDGMNALLEELIVRKELADNYCFYNKNYKSLDGAPPWALKSLLDHSSDPREYTYTPSQLEKAQTHDDAWNAAQLQLTTTGKMHGYMRMYWAKKILEWSLTPSDAVACAIYLNDKYSIDGADPNGYVGILWSIAGLHDRPWFERPIFGAIRYMNYNGLKSKFNIAAYVNKYLPGINK